MFYIGVDLGGTNIKAGIIDDKFNVVKKGSTPTLPNRDPKEIIRDMAALCENIVNEAGITFDEIAYAGIASPGTANNDKGCVEYANNLPFLHFPIADVLMSFIPVKKVYVENDANAAAWAEAIAGAAKGVNHSIFITLGTGVGGGIIIDKKLYSGFNYAGAELGHMVIQYQGRKCTCGRLGCWESYSSATGLINMTKDKMLENKDSIMWEMCDGSVDNISGKTAFAAMRQNDSAGSEVVDMYIGYLACGLGNIINIFQPEIISIGGGICNEGDYLMKPLLTMIEAEQYGAVGREMTKIKIAELGNDAGILGAASLGMKI